MSNFQIRMASDFILLSNVSYDYDDLVLKCETFRCECISGECVSLGCQAVSCADKCALNCALKNLS